MVFGIGKGIRQLKEEVLRLKLELEELKKLVKERPKILGMPPPKIVTVPRSMDALVVVSKLLSNENYVEALKLAIKDHLELQNIKWPAGLISMYFPRCYKIEANKHYRVIAPDCVFVTFAIETPKNVAIEIKGETTFEILTNKGTETLVIPPITLFNNSTIRGLSKAAGFYIYLKGAMFSPRHHPLFNLREEEW